MIDAILDFLRDFGAWGLFIHAFADAVIFPIPAFFLQVSLSLINPSQALWLATVGYVACMLGTPLGYLIGHLLGDSVLQKFLKKNALEKAQALFTKNGEAAILIGAFTPIPFKVFTIMAGAMKFSLWKLIGYAALGRAVKFYAVGFLFYFYGRAAENLIDSYLTYIFLGIAVLLFIGIMIKRKIQHNKRPETDVEHTKAKALK
ncbi:YqaA family protein [Alkalicoccobacillus murimartini]|uniref:Membrane protein YqaA with SNARE-associated domain n=1 Tax=Alkalicoccobacillus murimartini TaxID=171685 RepID=A0ABT9YMX5_9BACI|nr:VTT domain-containing protein [Alkalicoccobacillus murimartini]MDQ0209207.1 membrane protein YqaA with SNARE-associated domain [Alkalicoccobacillus murimartini]